MFEGRDHVKKFLKYMNSRHLNIGFTCEEESEASFYKQVDGVAMGSLLGLTLPDLFLVYYEHKWLENCPLQFRSKYYRRYA